MVLNNVTKFDKNQIKKLLDWKKGYIFIDKRAKTPEGMVWYRPLSDLKSIMVLNKFTKFHKIQIKTIQPIRERCDLLTDVHG